MRVKLQFLEINTGCVLCIDIFRGEGAAKPTLALDSR